MLPAPWGRITVFWRRIAYRRPFTRPIVSAILSPERGRFMLFFTPVSGGDAAVDILRKNQARDNYISQQEEETEFLNGIIEQETLNLLYEAIENLPEKYRRIFELHFEQGLKNAEIAAQLGLFESTVKKQKARMLKLLREDLQQRTGGDLLCVCMLLEYLYSSSL